MTGMLPANWLCAVNYLCGMKKCTLFFTIIVVVLNYSCQSGKHSGVVKPDLLPFPNLDSLERVNKLIGKNYYIVDSAENADFNYPLLNKFNSKMEAYHSPDSASVFFRPVRGIYKYYQFIATYKGLAYRNTIQELNDILIIKTDPDHYIIDAYQYTLEWREYPFTSDLYLLTNKGVRLTNQLNLNLLRMKRVYNYNENYILDDEGKIFLKPMSKN